MLGYRGRSGRRDFIAGAALLLVGSHAVSMAVKPSLPWLFATFDRAVALTGALILSLFVCAVVVLWFWGWTVLATRRARDMGLPAWAGALSLFILVGIGRWTTELPAPYPMIASSAVLIGWLVAFSMPPSRREAEAGPSVDPGMRAA